MSAFEYVAVDAAGRERKGVLEGDNARARAPVAARPEPAAGRRHRGHRTGNRARRRRQRPAVVQFPARLSAADLSLVTRQLATLVKSALPLEEALLAVSQQTDKPRVRNIMLGVRSQGHGRPRAGRQPGRFSRTSFPEIYRATIAASEHSGHLDSVMERLADYTENREELRSRTLGAMLYPVLLFLVCVVDRLLPAGFGRAERSSRCSATARPSCRC